MARGHDRKMIELLESLLGPASSRSSVATDRDGATLRVDSVVEIDGIDSLARVLSGTADALIVAIVGRNSAEIVDRQRARRVVE